MESQLKELENCIKGTLGPAVVALNKKVIGPKVKQLTPTRITKDSVAGSTKSRKDTSPNHDLTLSQYTSEKDNCAASTAEASRNEDSVSIYTVKKTDLPSEKEITEISNLTRDYEETQKAVNLMARRLLELQGVPNTLITVQVKSVYNSSMQDEEVPPSLTE